MFSYKENQRLKTRKEGENIALGRWVALENSVSSVWGTGDVVLLGRDV